MTRFASIVLLVGLLLAVGWAARRDFSAADDTASVPVDADWLAAHQDTLRRIINVPPGVELEFKQVVGSDTPGYQRLVLDLTFGEARRPLELQVSQDGRRIVFDRIYDLDDPFRRFRQQINLEDAPARGPADAPVTIVEYSDYTCGYCRQFFNQIEQPFFERYGDRVRFVYKHFPLVGMRSWSQQAAVAGACAFRQGNDKFWELHPKLFRAATQLREGEPLLLELARQTSLDFPRFRRCLKQQDGLIEVNEDLREGNRMGVNGTPTFFVNGRPIPGLVAPRHFFQIVEEELRFARR